MTHTSTDTLSVLVAGLLPQQASLVRDEFKGRLDLRFWKDGAASQLRYSARSADVVVLFSSMSSHRTQNVLKQCARRLVPCPGGMTNLRKKLEEIANE